MESRYGLENREIPSPMTTVKIQTPKIGFKASF